MRRQLLHTVMSGKDGRDTTFDVSRRKILLATTTLAAASALGSAAHAQTAQAQTVTTAQAQAKYTPDQAKAFEDWTYAVALDAANWGSPAVIMYNLRANDAVGPKPKAAPNSIWRMDEHFHTGTLGRGGLRHPERQRHLRLRLPGPRP